MDDDSAFVIYTGTGKTRVFSKLVQELFDIQVIDSIRVTSATGENDE